MLPRLLKAYAGCGGLHVYTDTVFEDGDLVGKQIIGRREGRSAETGVQQGLQKPLRILRRGFDQDIQVECGTPCRTDAIPPITTYFTSCC